MWIYVHMLQRTGMIPEYIVLDYRGERFDIAFGCGIR